MQADNGKGTLVQELSGTRTEMPDSGMLMLAASTFDANAQLC
jgi:hypothetical protein